MGTHPIFESDFDCLTEMSLFDIAKQNPFGKPVVSDAAPSCEFGSTEYYLKCMIGGALSCGLTHTAVVPLDLVKCRMQVDAAKYPSWVRASRSLLPREASKLWPEDGRQLSSVTRCRELASSVSTKSSRTFTETLWERKTPSFTELIFTWRPPLPPSSSPISPLLLWKLSRFESKLLITPRLSEPVSQRCRLKKATEPSSKASSHFGCDRFHTQ